MEVNRTCIGSRIFFRCLIFDCYSISICKKGKVKDETSKKIFETNGGQIKDLRFPTGMDVDQFLIVHLIKVLIPILKSWSEILRKS